MSFGIGWDGNAMTCQQGNLPEGVSLPEHFPIRDDLQFIPRNDGSGYVVLEDRLAGKFFRIGKSEHQFIEALLTTESASAAFEYCQQRRGEVQLSVGECAQLCSWLAANGLTRTSPTINTSVHRPKKTPILKTLTATFFWKVPLVNPARLLNRLSISFGWLFHATAMCLGVLVLLGALVATAGRWAEFAGGYENLFSAWRWLTLAVAWCALKLIHEIAHGATCRRYGGEVKEAGVAMILLVPIAYVDVTSSWRFDSRWKRLHVTLAGVGAELLFAGLALIVWNLTNTPTIQQVASDVVVLASVNSLVFNLNPLLKFDGYFALADLTGIDNLYQYGQKYARYFGGRYILGLDVPPVKLPGKSTGWIKFYGCSAAVYRVATICGLLIAAATLLHGAGIIIAIAGFVSFVIAPLLVLSKWLVGMYREGSLQPIRLVIRTTGLLLLAIGSLFVIPADWSRTAPAIVQYDPPTVIRTRSPGFVESVHVADGDKVIKGQPLVTLRNDNLQLQLLRLQKELAQVEQQILSAQWRGDSSELSDAVARRDGLKSQVEELQIDVNQLIVRAPAEGTVVSRRLVILEGTYVNAGEELAVIGREHFKRLKLSINQSEASQAATWQTRPLRIVVDGLPTWTTKLTRLETRADTTPPDSSLLAVNGGSLTAVQHSANEFRLCEPRVNAYVMLTASQSQKLMAGRRAFVAIQTERRTLGDWLLAVIGPRFLELLSTDQ